MSVVRNEFGELKNRIDRGIHLLAVLAVKGLDQREQIALLDRAGFEPREIADVIGTTSNTVRVALVTIRRDGHQRRKKAKKGQEDANSKDRELMSLIVS